MDVSFRPGLCCRRSQLAVLIAAACALAGCRIQRGGGGAPSIEEDVAATPRAAGSGGAATAHEDADEPAPLDAGVGRGSAAGASGRPAQQPAAPSGNAGTTSAGRDAGTRPASAPPSGSTSECGATADIAVCNPVSNTGCAAELGMQCDVDLVAPELTGTCVFSSPAPDGGTCLNIPPTESCPAGQTCVDFRECRKVCLCDSDCDAGDCCADELGDQGWKTCRKC